MKRKISIIGASSILNRDDTVAMLRDVYEIHVIERPAEPFFDINQRKRRRGQRKGKGSWE